MRAVTIERDAARLRPWFAARGVADMLVPDRIRKTVGFIGIRDGGEFRPRATGFFVSLFERDLQFNYLVTAHHVVGMAKTEKQDIWLRTNEKDGTVSEAVIPFETWIEPEGDDRTDVAASLVHFDSRSDVSAIALNGAKSIVASQTVIDAQSIGVGEEVAIVGMFRSHYGQNRNVPVVRIGNIAAMPEERVKTAAYGFVEAFLVEARSIGGLSGSPVFVNMAPVRIVDGRTVTAQATPQLYLLGLMHGHFDVPDLNSDVVVDRIGGQSLSINTGMGVVIPATKILDLLRGPAPTRERDSLAAAYFAHDAATPDAWGSPSPPGAPPAAGR